MINFSSEFETLRRIHMRFQLVDGAGTLFENSGRIYRGPAQPVVCSTVILFPTISSKMCHSEHELPWENQLLLPLQSPVRQAFVPKRSGGPTPGTARPDL
jgi:hypothetical protein